MAKKPNELFWPTRLKQKHISEMCPVKSQPGNPGIQGRNGCYK